MSRLTEKFSEAVDYARVAHASQFRKGTRIPYLYHPLAVASLVLEFGGNEEEAIAGLLHDVIEDCGEHHIGPISLQFGERVGQIVLACTDGSREGKSKQDPQTSAFERWRQRKLAYLDHVADAENDALLVSACDKLHNARAIVADLEDPSVGQAVFERFTGGREGTLAYYQTLLVILEHRRSPISPALSRAVAAMHSLAGESHRRVLADVSAIS